MGKLTYSAITSLDGYIADEGGAFDWAAPDAEVFAFVNDLERDVGTYLFGRRMYETMVYWETFEPTSEATSEENDFAAIWRAADKVVYSRTLEGPSSARTRVIREFDPEAVRQMKEGGADLSVGGSEIAGAALAAGLVDEVYLLVTPVSVGGGTPALPRHQRVDLTLQSVHRFASGVVHLHYRVTN